HESELARLQLSKKITRLNEQVETLEKELSATTDHATELEENLNQAQKQITQLRQQYVQLRDENIDNFSNFEALKMQKLALADKIIHLEHYVEQQIADNNRLKVTNAHQRTLNALLNERDQLMRQLTDNEDGLTVTTVVG